MTSWVAEFQCGRSGEFLINWQRGNENHFGSWKYPAISGNKHHLYHTYNRHEGPSSSSLYCGLPSNSSSELMIASHRWQALKVCMCLISRILNWHAIRKISHSHLFIRSINWQNSVTFLVPEELKKKKESQKSDFMKLGFLPLWNIFILKVCLQEIAVSICWSSS